MFDFTAAPGKLEINPHFWIYWAVTVPLTMLVLIIYLTYLIWIGRRHRDEDKKARESVPPTQSLESLEYTHSIRTRRGSALSSRPVATYIETLVEHVSRSDAMPSIKTRLGPPVTPGTVEDYTEPVSEHVSSSGIVPTIVVSEAQPSVCPSTQRTREERAQQLAASGASTWNSSASGSLMRPRPRSARSEVTQDDFVDTYSDIEREPGDVGCTVQSSGRLPAFGQVKSHSRQAGTATYNKSPGLRVTGLTRAGFEPDLEGGQSLPMNTNGLGSVIASELWNRHASGRQSHTE